MLKVLKISCSIFVICRAEEIVRLKAKIIFSAKHFIFQKQKVFVILFLKLQKYKFLKSKRIPQSHHFTINEEDVKDFVMYLKQEPVIMINLYTFVISE